jgi:hypothetical protein
VAVQPILAPIGLNFDFNPDDEAAVTIGQGLPNIKTKPKKPPKKAKAPPKKKRAFGGPVAAALSYQVGEFGRETFVPDSPGQIIPNGRGVGGNVIVQGDMVIKNTRDADRLARKLAFRLTY